MESTELSVQVRLLIALALGFLAGLERESSGAVSSHRVLAGVRTYTILSLFGYGCAWFQSHGLPGSLPVGLAAVAALSVSVHVAKVREGHAGWTSEVAALLTFVVGALALLAEIWLPMALGISSAILLSEKTQIEGMVERLERHEFLAILRFLVVTLLILPILPNQEYTDFRLNPARIWKIVIIISTIGFVGYVLVKKLGHRYGLWLSGLLGGIVSSTAASVAMGRFARQNPERAGSALQACLFASGVMYLRLIVLIALVGASFLVGLWWKLLALGIVGYLLAIGIRLDREESPPPSPAATLTNPYELTPAMVFAGFFVLLSVLIRLVRGAFGGTGLLLLAALVGLVDVDPFVLSLASGEPPAVDLQQAVLLAVMVNTLAKGGYFVFLSPRLRGPTVWRFLLWTSLHVPLLFL